MLNKKLSKHTWKVIKLLALGGILACSLIGIAQAADYVAVSTISKSVDKTVSQLATVLVDICLIAGIGFVTAAFFKFHQHKQNPQQVQMSQGVSLLLIGCGLTLVPLLIPTGSVAVLGSKGANTAQVGGSAIHGLIGKAT
jgi:intracellular multiplication protein IcmD